MTDEPEQSQGSPILPLPIDEARKRLSEEVERLRAKYRAARRAARIRAALLLAGLATALYLVFRR
jgi:hypothetical protein